MGNKVELTLWQKWTVNILQGYGLPIAAEVIKQAFPNYHLAKNPNRKKGVKEDGKRHLL